MLESCNIVIVGGEGDLAFRKLYPALFSLHKQNLLGDCTKIIAFVRGKYSPKSFIENLCDRLEISDYTDKISDGQWTSFSNRIERFVGDATNQTDFKRLKPQLKSIKTVVYLSTPPSIFGSICETMKKADFVNRTTRLVVEKPLGSSLKSFDEINNSLFKTFNERQLYRIDHYLGKETVQNLLAMRFANILFEPLWNRSYIDHVQITLSESVGVGNRWSYYNESGALRDMVQNHILQLLCLVAMEYPARNKPDDVRDEKLKVLRCLKKIDATNVESYTVRGQYSQGAVGEELVKGYLYEEDAAHTDSNTETFVAIKAEIENNRWQGVPFYLRTGKRMTSRYAEIVIQFKPVVFKLFDTAQNEANNNRLVIRLQPNEGIQMNLMNKVPGLNEKTELQNLGLDLSFSDAFEDHRSPSAYERLLLDVTRGDQTLFMRSDELREAWKWVDGIIDGWEKVKQKTIKYVAGSAGPTDSFALIHKDGRKWLDENS